MKAVYIIPLALPATDIIPHKLHDSLKLLGLHPGLYPCVYPHAEISNAQYMPHSSRIFSTVTNKKCLITYPSSLNTG